MAGGGETSTESWEGRMEGTPNSAGLDGVVAAETAISDVDGAAGQLVLRGVTLDAAAGDMDFEALTALLWRGLDPALQDPGALRPRLGEARMRAFERLAHILPAAAGLPPIEALRVLLSCLSDQEDRPHHLLAVAAMPVFVAALGRVAGGADPLAPDPASGHAADFLRMLCGVPAPAPVASALDTYLVTVADHGLNASTFTARVIASTRAGTFSAVVGALCALKGPLHGGAPGPVLDMLDEIGSPAAIGPWLEGKLAAGERLMGFGHRVYRVRDPRADVLKDAVGRLSGGRIAFAEQVEAQALAALAEHKPGRSLQTNVEFYTALLLDAVGLSAALFTPVFAVGRVAGWTAHILEQQQTGRLVRPESRYVGPRPEIAA